MLYFNLNTIAQSVQVKNSVLGFYDLNLCSQLKDKLIKNNTPI